MADISDYTPTRIDSTIYYTTRANESKNPVLSIPYEYVKQKKTNCA